MNRGQILSTRFCAAVLASILLAGCSDPTGDLQPSIAIVHGAVVDVSGTPVSDALVRVLVSAADGDHCDPSDWLAGTTTTDVSGAYSVTGAYAHVSTAEMCVALEVEPLSPDYLAASVEGGRVLFKHQSSTPPVDSIKVDAILEFAE